jgi:hypothetical protein
VGDARVTDALAAACELPPCPDARVLQLPDFEPGSIFR